MALSVLQNRGGPIWPLGYVNVAANGTKVCIMVNVDANNNYSPGGNYTPGSSVEYPATCRGIHVQGFKPGAGNNGMIPNNGNVYLLLAPQGSGTGNRADSGAMVAVIPPGADYFLPASPIPMDMLQPNSFFIDVDNNNEGAVVALYGGGTT